MLYVLGLDPSVLPLRPTERRTTWICRPCRPLGARPQRPICVKDFKPPDLDENHPPRRVSSRMLVWTAGFSTTFLGIATGEFLEDPARSRPKNPTEVFEKNISSAPNCIPSFTRQAVSQGAPHYYHIYLYPPRARRHKRAVDNIAFSDARLTRCRSRWTSSAAPILAAPIVSISCVFPRPLHSAQ